MRGKPNKLGEGERKVRLGQDRLAIKSGNERKLYTLFYLDPAKLAGMGVATCNLQVEVVY